MHGEPDGDHHASTMLDVAVPQATQSCPVGKLSATNP
jgi:hypothetical protein